MIEHRGAHYLQSVTLWVEQYTTHACSWYVRGGGGGRVVERKTNKQTKTPVASLGGASCQLSWHPFFFFFLQQMLFCPAQMVGKPEIVSIVDMS